jgi:gas vesicle protein
LEYSKSINSIKKNIMSAKKVVIGALVGALLGLLYAPVRGAVTRRFILRRGEKQVTELKDKFSDFIDSIINRFDEVKDEVIDLVDEVKIGADKGPKAPKKEV